MSRIDKSCTPIFMIQKIFFFNTYHLKSGETNRIFLYDKELKRMDKRLVNQQCFTNSVSIPTQELLTF